MHNRDCSHCGCTLSWYCFVIANRSLNLLQCELSNVLFPSTNLDSPSLPITKCFHWPDAFVLDCAPINYILNNSVSPLNVPLTHISSHRPAAAARRPSERAGRPQDSFIPTRLLVSFIHPPQRKQTRIVHTFGSFHPLKAVDCNPTVASSS